MTKTKLLILLCLVALALYYLNQAEDKTNPKLVVNPNKPTKKKNTILNDEPRLLNRSNEKATYGT
jgi:lipopolysaccharide export system protein LptC